MNLRGPTKFGEFLDQLRTGYIFKKGSAPWNKKASKEIWRDAKAG
jgi:hypothetical protein